jgi:hypothetical protein
MSLNKDSRIRENHPLQLVFLFWAAPPVPRTMGRLSQQYLPQHSELMKTSIDG